MAGSTAKILVMVKKMLCWEFTKGARKSSEIFNTSSFQKNQTLSMVGNEPPSNESVGRFTALSVPCKLFAIIIVNTTVVRTTAFRQMDHLQLLSTALWSIRFSIFKLPFQVHKGLARCVDTELLRQQLDAVKCFQRLMAWLGFHPTSAYHSSKFHQRYLSGKRYLYRHWYDFC